MDVASYQVFQFLLRHHTVNGSGSIQGCHQSVDNFFGDRRLLDGLLRSGAGHVAPEAGSVREEDFFEGPGGVGLIGGSGGLFPGIPGFGIPAPEGEDVAVPVDEFVGFDGFGGGVKAAGLEFLNLLHVVSSWLR